MKLVFYNNYGGTKSHNLPFLNVDYFFGVHFRLLAPLAPFVGVFDGDTTVTSDFDGDTTVISDDSGLIGVLNGDAMSVELAPLTGVEVDTELFPLFRFESGVSNPSLILFCLLMCA